MKRTRGIAIGIGILFVVLIFSCSSEKEETVVLETPPQKDATTQPVNTITSEITEPSTPTSKPKEPEPPLDPAAIANYKIVDSKDISIKALTRPLSEYALGEIEKLPDNIRKEYQVVVPTNISPSDLESALIHLVRSESAREPDIDEIVAFAYDDKKDIGYGYTYGKIEWCPNGVWGGVTPEIAKTNDRTTYRYKIDIKEKVGKTSEKPNKREEQIHHAMQKMLFDKPEVPEEEVKKAIAKKFRVSLEELDEIYLKVEVYRMQ